MEGAGEVLFWGGFGFGELTLNEELHEETGGGEGVFTGGKDPGGNHASRQEGCADHGAATTDELRCVADNCAADAGAGFHPDGGTGCSCVIKTLGLSHEGCVAIFDSC